MLWSRGRGRRRSGPGSVALAEFVDATRRIHDLLFAGVERMAHRADFDMQRLTDRRTRGEGIPATASHLDFSVLWVYAGFHCILALGVCAGVAPTPSSARRGLWTNHMRTNRRFASKR